MGTTRARRISRIGTAVVAIAACAGVLAACGSGGSPASSAKTSGGSGNAGSGNAGSGNTVDVKNFSFTPGSLTISKGATVTWKFDDAAKHNVTASGNIFKSPDLSSGGSYAFTFTKPGTYNYICTIHQYMKGTVTVR